MKHLTFSLIIFSAFACTKNKASATLANSTKKQTSTSTNLVSPTSQESSFYDISCINIEGQPIKLSDYDNHLILIVNIASGCGYVNQLGALQSLYQTYKEQKFIVIAVPSNQFYQESLNNPQIGEFCKRNYGVSFPILAKTDLNGTNRHPLYTYLLENAPKGQQMNIRWNYEKFLIKPKGKVTKRFSSSTQAKAIEPYILEFNKKQKKQSIKKFSPKSLETHLHESQY